ncbi:unnamed protein product [Brassica oleracea]
MFVHPHLGTIKEKANNCTNAHFMLIEGMSKLLTRKVKRCKSLDFHVSGLKWKFVIHSDVVKDYISFFLHITDEKCTGSNWQINCSVKLSVVSQNGPPDICKVFVTCFDEKYPSWGQDMFITDEVLKEKYLLNDKAVFSAEITNVKPNFLKVTSISPTMGTAESLKLMDVARKNSRFTWKITRFSSFDGVTHSSYEFTLGPRRWKLEMYPKGDKRGKGHLSFYLTATDYVTNLPKGPTLAVYKLRLLDQLKRNHKEPEYQALFAPGANSWGCSKYIPLTELHNTSNGYLVNDQIYLSVEFLIVSTTEYL